MAKFNTIEALKEGMINLCKLNKEDQYLLVLIAGDTNYVIPFLKGDAGCLAYIPSSVSTEEYTNLSLIIETISQEKVYRGMYTYKPIMKDAPAHCMEVVKTEKPSVGEVVAENVKEIVESHGYTWLVGSSQSLKKTLDYSDLMSNPKYKQIFEEDEEELKKVGATFEGLSDEIKVAYESIKNDPKTIGVIFEGPTGTGKSVGARILANKMGAPLLSIQFTYGTAIEDLIGSFVPNTGATINEAADKEIRDLMDSYEKGEITTQVFFDKAGQLTGSTGAKWTFKMGPLLEAYVNGCQLVGEEINYASAGIIAKLNEFTDDTLRVTVNGETYRRHPRFKCYFTMNPGYAGTDPLNVALKNRFAKVNIPALTKEEFTKRAQIYSKNLGHELGVEFFSKLYDFALFIEKEGENNQWHENIKFSIRNCQRLCFYLLTEGRTFEEFRAAMAIQYLNDLATDNDNSEKLETFKESPEIQKKIKDIYYSYDFAAIKTKKVEKSFGSFFIEDGENSSSSKSAKSEMMDDFLSKLGI